MANAETTAEFLLKNGLQDVPRMRLVGDASSRIYERLAIEKHRSVLLVKSQKEVAENFIVIRKLLSKLQLSVPSILAEDAHAGLLLVEDFGNNTYTNLLKKGASPMPLYELAVDTLIYLHKNFRFNHKMSYLPVFDVALLQEQALLFCTTYLPKVYGRVQDSIMFDFLKAWEKPLLEATTMPNSLLLRDFHAGNLFYLPNRTSIQACGLIDFQDAGFGPRTYDLVSLLQDARLDLSAELEATCITRYSNAFPNLEPETFKNSYAILAAQRHVRVIAIFSRLAEEGKTGYTHHLPRLWKLLNNAFQNPKLAPVAAWFQKYTPRSIQP